MKKGLFTGVLIVSALWLSAQSNLYNTKAAKITFYSSAPLEDIKSVNPNVNCILNIGTGEMAFKVIMTSFQFEKQAMKDHFNADYVESGKYPEATLTATIQENSKIDYKKNGIFPVIVTGFLTIHGVKKAITQSGKLEIKNNMILLNAKFDIKLSDYKVIVPNNYLKKINNILQISVDATLQPYVR